jgi:excisionase family DNA binding protein
MTSSFPGQPSAGILRDIKGIPRSPWVLTLMDAVNSPKLFEPLWHPVDAATYLGLHEKTVIRMARLRQIPSFRLGKLWRFRASDLTAWAADQVKSNRQPGE